MALKHIINTDTKGNKIDEYDIDVKSGKKEGVHIQYYISNHSDDSNGKDKKYNGFIVSKTNYVNGLRNGEDYEYYINDKNSIELKCHYSNDLRNGEYIRYYEDGSKKVECNYLDDKIFGFLTAYANNIRILHATYVNGKMNGSCIFYENGIKIRECYYVDNIYHGRDTHYKRLNNGTTYICKEVDYSNGAMNGKYITYNEDGFILKEAKYVNGIEV